MVTSSSGNILNIIGPLWGESTGDWWIPHTKARDSELWSFLWSAPEWAVDQTFEISLDDVCFWILTLSIQKCYQETLANLIFDMEMVQVVQILSHRTQPGSKDPLIIVDKISIQILHVGWMSNWLRSEGLCYLAMYLFIILNP